MESISSRLLRSALVLTVGCALSGLYGCAATRLRTDYGGYENAYANSSNREMLLNLARLNQHDPTFFFKMGQITTTYRMTASVNGNGSKVIQGTATGANNIGGAATSIGIEKDPVFQFIPVNDDATAQMLLTPIHPETFEALYQQGWRVDQLFRLMVDRIEYFDPNAKVWVVIRNLPTQDNEFDFTRFLRISALAYELQRRGYLLLRPHKHDFTPLADGLALKSPPEAKDLMDAQAKNLIYKQVNGNWELGQENVTYQFELNGLDAAAKTKIIKEMPELNNGGITIGTTRITALDAMLLILQKGFSIQPAVTSTDTGDESAGSARLVMRSMMGILTAAAQEQDGYADFQKNPVISAPAGETGSSESLPFNQLVPTEERRPILRLTWSSEDSVLDPLVQLNYANREFMITDLSEPKTPEETAWNRDLFRLISEIAAQVTVDISKFPLPLLLQ